MMKNYQLKTKAIKKSLWFMAICFLVGVQGLFAQTITYSFANAKMTDGSGGTGTTHYEVDVLIATDTDFKLGLGKFYIDYNTAAFGSSVVANGRVIDAHPFNGGTGPYLPGPYALDEIYLSSFNVYIGLTHTDVTSSKLSVEWVQQLGESVISENVTTGSPSLIYHLILEYTDNSQDPMISFDSVLSQDETFIASPAAPGGTTTGATLITNDSYDSSGAALPANTWTGTTDTDWDTATNWSSGSVPTGTSTVTIDNVANDPVASGGINVDKMTLNSGAQLTVNGAVTNNGVITVNSGASFIAKTSVSGTVTYNRTIATTNWYLISSPVVGQDIDAFATAEGLAAGTANNRGLSSYNNSTPGWVYYQDGASGTGNFLQGEARSLKLAASGDIAFTGTMPVSDVGVSISSNMNGFNLIGNPYPSFIPANTNADVTNNVLTINSASLTEETLWFWNQGMGSYDQVNQALASRFIAPGQGFFVSSNGSNTFNFTEAMQSHQTDNFQRNANTRPEILLSVTDGIATRTTDIYYIAGTTPGWDNGYDSTIFGGVANSFAIYTHLVNDSNGQNLGIQSLPDTNFEDMVIPIGINAVSGTELTFSTTSIHIPNGLNVILEDRQTNTFTILDESNDQYTATLDTDTNDIGRFYLHVSTLSILSTEELIEGNVSIYTTNNDTNLRITGIAQGKTKVQMFSILGREVMGNTFMATGLNDILLPALKTGIYIVKITNEEGKTVIKKIMIQS